MKLSNIKDVFFDLDHTLWDFDKNSALTFNEIFKLNHINIDLEKFLSFYEPINQNYWKLYREEKIDKESLRFGRLFDAFKEVGYDVEDDLIHKLSEEYIEILPSNNYLFKGTFEILEYLQPKYNLHIITNGFKEVQHGKLEKSGISKYFKTVTNSEAVGVKKPNPKIFDYAIELSRAKKEESIMIGDNIEADIQGAIDVGIQAIHFSPNGLQKNGYITINSLIQLKNYL